VRSATRSQSDELRYSIVSSYQPYGSVFCCAHVHIEESNEKRDKSSGADLNDLKRQLRNMESQHQVRSVS
jgi:hypothetical protein